jgi:hypothetical protein
LAVRRRRFRSRKTPPRKPQPQILRRPHGGPPRPAAPRVKLRFGFASANLHPRPENPPSTRSLNGSNTPFPFCYGRPFLYRFKLSNQQTFREGGHGLVQSIVIRGRSGFRLSRGNPKRPRSLPSDKDVEQTVRRDASDPQSSPTLINSPPAGGLVVCPIRWNRRTGPPSPAGIAPSCAGVQAAVARSAHRRCGIF